MTLSVLRGRVDVGVKHVRSKGVEVYGPTHLDWMKATSYYFYDRDANLLEFWSSEPA